MISIWHLRFALKYFGKQKSKIEQEDGSRWDEIDEMSMVVESGFSYLAVPYIALSAFVNG